MFDICNKLIKPLTSTEKDNVLSLLKTSTSYRKIAAQTGVSKSKVAVLAKEAYPDKENLPAGHPKKLSSVDEHAIIKWRRVLWSDETKINRFGSDGQQYV